MIVAIVLLTSIDAAAIAAYRGLSKNKIPRDLTKDHLKPEVEFEIERQKTQKLVDQCGHRWCDLRSQNIKVIQGVIWPDGIQSLSLCNNEINNVNGVCFNDKLVTMLSLNSNKGITSFKNTHFPINLDALSLVRMDLSYQALASIDWSAFVNLHYLSIQCNPAIFDESSEVMHFPQTVRVLSMDWSLLKSMMESGQSMSLPNLTQLNVRKEEKVTVGERQALGAYFGNHRFDISIRDVAFQRVY